MVDKNNFQDVVDEMREAIKEIATKHNIKVADSYLDITLTALVDDPDDVTGVPCLAYSITKVGNKDIQRLNELILNTTEKAKNDPIFNLLINTLVRALWENNNFRRLRRERKDILDPTRPSDLEDILANSEIDPTNN